MADRPGFGRIGNNPRLGGANPGALTVGALALGARDGRPRRGAGTLEGVGPTSSGTARERGRAFSAEGNSRSPQVWDPPKPRPAHDPRRASATWGLLRAIPTAQYRAITWRYCFPWLPVAIPLRSLSRRLDYRVTLREYEHLVLLGEYAVAAALSENADLVYSPPPSSGARRVVTL